MLTLTTIYQRPYPAGTLTVHLITGNTAPDGYPAEASKKGRKSLISNTELAIGLGESPTLEGVRMAMHEAITFANDYRFERMVVEKTLLTPTETVALAESALLSSYQFTAYKSKSEPSPLTEVHIFGADAADIQQGTYLAQATIVARDLVNEPAITLTATEYSHRIEALGKAHGFTVEVFNKARIQALKMGGLLGVNAGSQEQPTFTVMEYKPAGVSTHPIILVGKGVVYDTGGLSLKTSEGMETMKCDMAGSAAVVGAFVGASLLKLPVHLVGLIPATDNRPGENAIVPGDVITMYDGTTVEVLNTDAEGRLILADALAYAKQYHPELVIDLATLTGASVVAVGSPGSAMMGTASDATKAALKAAGEAVYERLVEFPLWDEYGDMIKSEVADLKNLGGREGGAITAGKFLQHFTSYPWIHLDIAGPAFLGKPSGYRKAGGTGVGVRLLLEFLKK